MMQRPSWEIRVRDPRRERWLRLFILLLVLAIPLAWYAGYWMEHEKLAPVLEQNATQERQLARLTEDLEQARRKLAVLSSGESLSQQATEQSRLSIRLLEGEIYQLQQELATCKGALAGGKTDSLRIRSFDVLPGNDPQRFAYKLFLSRSGAGNVLEGTLKIEVRGRKDGKTVTLPLDELSKDIPAAGLTFSVRNFQSFPEGGRAGELRLPAGFEAQEVRVVATLKGQSQPVEKTFKWQSE